MIPTEQHQVPPEDPRHPQWIAERRAMEILRALIKRAEATRPVKERTER